MTIRIIAVAVLIATLVQSDALSENVWPPFWPVKRQEKTLETLKHKIVIAETGLPEQIYIKPDARDLPLEMRNAQPALDDPALVAFGRGARLRQPIRLVANVGGNKVEATIRTTAQLTAESPEKISYRSELTLGPISATLQSDYCFDGAMGFDVQWKSGEPVESFEIVVGFAGAVTHAYRGLPSDFNPDAIARETLDVLVPADTDATVWTNLRPWRADDVPTIRYLYVGSLDSGFTWLADNWEIADAEKPMMVIRRDKAGNASMSIFFLNTSAETAEGRNTFSLLPHPAKPHPQSFRKTQWLEWDQNKTLAPVPDGLAMHPLKNVQAQRDRMPERGYVTGAMAAAAYESVAAGTEMTGFAGAFGVSAEKDNIRLYPASLFAVLAAPYTGVPTRLHSNMRKLAFSGEAPSYDRQYLGRALLHDIGAAIEGFKQPYQYIRLVDALKEFGFFDTENIEVLPYWRNSDIIRYGEPWSADDPFAVDAEDPAAGVYVTAYRKPIETDGRKGYAALIVVMNERDKPVRERLFVFDTKRLFGGPNQFKAPDLFKKYPFEILPEQSNWHGAKGGYASWHGSRAQKEEYFQWMKGVPPALRDVEDDSYVEHFPTRNAPPPEVYGPLYINPRDYRLLYGYWIAEE